jgi:PEP-CTERM motif
MRTYRVWTYAVTTALVVAATAGPAQAGLVFTTVDPGGSTNTVIDGISNTGEMVGQATIGGNTVNFIANVSNPNATFQVLNTLPTGAMAFGINSSNEIVGSIVNAGSGMPNAFLLTSPTAAPTLLKDPNTNAAPSVNTNSTAFGISDQGTIVGQFLNANTGTTSGFVYNTATNSYAHTPLDPTGSIVTNVQGVNNHGLGVGFFATTNTPIINANPPQTGFQFDANGVITVLPPPNVANYFLTQLLGVNDSNQAVGYFQDTFGSQHGLLRDLNSPTSGYTFADDPNQGAFALNGNMITVTQITGIANSGTIAGFYMDANGVSHGFFATQAVPEPGSLALLGIGVGCAALCLRGRAGAAGRSG